VTDWSLPKLDGVMGKTPEEVLNYCDCGRVDWANWSMRDMRRWLRDVRAYEQRVVARMAQIESGLPAPPRTDSPLEK